MANKKYCNCGNPAKWLYMPISDNIDNPYYCEKCVPRGCSCNSNIIVQEDTAPDLSTDGIENVNWKWIVKGKEWCYLDNGLEYPCCEYDYDHDGDNFADDDD